MSRTRRVRSTHNRQQQPKPSSSLCVRGRRVVRCHETFTCEVNAFIYVHTKCNATQKNVCRICTHKTRCICSILNESITEFSASTGAWPSSWCLLSRQKRLTPTTAACALNVSAPRNCGRQHGTDRLSSTFTAKAIC